MKKLSVIISAIMVTLSIVVACGGGGGGSSASGGTPGTGTITADNLTSKTMRNEAHISLLSAIRLLRILLTTRFTTLVTAVTRSLLNRIL